MSGVIVESKLHRLDTNYICFLWHLLTTISYHQEYATAFIKDFLSYVWISSDITIGIEIVNCFAEKGNHGRSQMQC